MPDIFDISIKPDLILKDTFKIGDVVRLNSGGQCMTVNRAMDNGEFEVVWMGEDGIMRIGFVKKETAYITSPYEKKARKKVL